MQAAHEAALLQAAACLEQQQHRCTQLEEAAAQSSGTAVQLHEQLQAAQTEHADALKQAELRHAEVSKDTGDLEIVSFAGVTVLILPALSAIKALMARGSSAGRLHGARSRTLLLRVYQDS